MDNSAHHHHRNAKSVVSLLILLIAFMILVIFSANKEDLMQPDVFPMFITLAAVGLTLLTGLLFLVGKEHKPAKARASHKSSKKSTSKKKKKK